jgi:hypothetical protein
LSQINCKKLSECGILLLIQFHRLRNAKGESEWNADIAVYRHNEGGHILAEQVLHCVENQFVNSPVFEN